MTLRSMLIAIALLTSSSEFVFSCTTDAECSIQCTQVSFCDDDEEVI